MAGLQKEIWVDSFILRRDGDIFKDSHVLSHQKNMTNYVDNNQINWAFAGAPANVIKNAVYPLPVVQRTDKPDYTNLDNYSTEAIMVRDVEEIELDYDKRADYLRDTQDNLIAQVQIDCMWALGPSANSIHTPIHNTPVANALGADGYRLVTADDIKSLRVRLDTQYPAHKNDAWVLMLDTESFWGMINADPHLKSQAALNQATGVRDAAFVRYYNFEIYQDPRTPWYSAVGTKLAVGSTPITGMDLPSCIAYVKQKSGFFALGTTKMFADIDNPIEQGSMWSFLTRAKAGMFGALTGQEMLAGAILRTV